MNSVIDFTTTMLGLQGIKVIHTDVDFDIFTVFVKSIYDHAICPKCGKIVVKVHDVRVQCYNHLPIWGIPTLLVLPIRRFECECDSEHPFDESYEFIRRYQRQTIPFEQYVFDLCCKNTILNVSVIMGISHGTCQRIFNYYAQEYVNSKEIKPIKYIGIDDIAVRKGHNYKTMVYNLETGEVIGVIDGRTMEAVIEFFNKQTQKFRDGIFGVAIDMSKSYYGAVKAALPNAKTVIDRFHISQLFHKLVDDARKHIQNRVRKEENDKGKIFGIRWALLKNYEDLTGEEAFKLLRSASNTLSWGNALVLRKSSTVSSI